MQRIPMQLERLKKSLEVKLTKLYDQSRKDNVVNFEELGMEPDDSYVEPSQRTADRGR